MSIRIIISVDLKRVFFYGVLAILLSPLCLSVGLLAEEKDGADGVDYCRTCHQELEVLPSDFHQEDIHLQRGLSCAGCHGGDPSQEDMDMAKRKSTGFRGVPARKDIPDFCGRCHSDIKLMRAFQPRIPTDQVDQYYTSLHGQKFKKGDSRVATCISCHTGHAILSAKDTRSSVHPLKVPATCDHCHGDADYMKPYGIPTDQYEAYAASVHGVALLENQDTGSPACNDCHGNHGAMPPGITSIAHVCGLCHVNNMQYFSKSKMGRIFEEQELHACEECHGNHRVLKTSDDMVGTGEKSVCLECHAEGDAGFQVAAQLHAELDSLVNAYAHAEDRLAHVQRIGMDDVEIGFSLQNAKQSLIKARTLVHTFDPAQVGALSGEGEEHAAQAIKLAESQIHEYAVRRKGFGITTIFITILIIALFFKIREIDRK